MDLAGIPLPGDALPLGAGIRQASCSGVAPERTLLTCCVRLSPEKDPLRFVEVVECLAAKGVLERLQVSCVLSRPPGCVFPTHHMPEALPSLRCSCNELHLGDRWLSTCWRRSRLCCLVLLKLHMPKSCGAAFAPLRQRAERRSASWGRGSIAGVYAHTRLNFHPCLYDAFGMTIIEAASQGAPLLGPCDSPFDVTISAIWHISAPRVTCMTQPGDCRMPHQGRPLCSTEVGPWERGTCWLPHRARR